MKKVAGIMILTVLIFGCAATIPIQRTDDAYDPINGSYLNSSLSLKIPFPEDKWKVFTDLDKVTRDIFEDIKATERESGGEFAMMGYHVSRAMFVILAVEKNISGLSPMEYLKLIKEINKKDYSTGITIFERERKIDEQACAESEHSFEFEGVDLTMGELFFLRNNYGCRLRFWAPTVIYESRKSEIENILDNIQFQ